MTETPRRYPVADGHFANRSILLTAGGDPVALALAAAFSDLGAVVTIADEGETAAAALDRAPVAVDTLVNSGWRKARVPAEVLSQNDWYETMATLVDRAFAFSTEFARRRIALAAPGAILTLVDATELGMPGSSATAAAQAALQNLARSWAVEWATDGLRVNVVACGLVEGRADPAFALATERGIDAAETIPLGRIATPADIVNAALYLCSEYGVYFTGTTVLVDGGENLRHSLGGPGFTAPRLWAAQG